MMKKRLVVLSIPWLLVSLEGNQKTVSNSLFQPPKDIETAVWDING